MSTRNMRLYSLRRRLLWLLTLLSVLLWLMMAVSSYYQAHHEADEIFDAQLAEMAQALLVIADTGTPGQQLVMPSPAHRYQQKILFQIWGTGGAAPVLLVNSDNAPLEPVTEASGFSEREWNGELWRFYSQEDAAEEVPSKRHRVLVAQSHAVRDELAEDMAIRQLQPLLLGLPLLGLAIWLAVGAATGPLSNLAGQLRNRHPERLDPLEASGPMPEEVAPLVMAINDLFWRVEETLAYERNFTADAAHELRTPLAALKVQAQVAQRAADESVRMQALAQVVAGGGRMTHLVEQLLTLARLDPLSLQQTTQAGVVDLVALAAEAAALAMPQAEERQQSLEVDIGPAAGAPLVVRGNAGLLLILVRNLLENAIRYTPPGGRIEIRVVANSLCVADSGPGIPAEERGRVLDRFYRRQEVQGQGAEGAGLGLSIVARIAQLHGAELSLEQGDAATGLGGLVVRVCFIGN